MLMQARTLEQQQAMGQLPVLQSKQPLQPLQQLLQ